MKLTSSALTGWLLAAAASFALGCPAGTPASTTPAPTAPVTEAPATTDPLVTADGRHFAAERTYKGECAPAGSRGGCYSIRLSPDGTYQQMLLDAAVGGTYEIKGDQVALTPRGDMEPASMPLSADRTRLGDYVFVPAVDAVPTP